ncbi:MAG: mycothiol synthase [Bifidobacteriaceae bacterium]|nr:mycothiol synthase [Bifidobacteriaceae bacterium]
MAEFAVAVKRGRLSGAARQEIAQLMAQAEAADGVAPVSEAPRLALDAGDRDWTHFLAYGDRRLVGYAVADPGFAGVELVVAQGARRQGVGRLLATRIAAAAPGPKVKGWAHGALRPATGFAAALGGRPVRELAMMSSRSLLGPGVPPLRPDRAAPPVWPLRPFNRGQDTESWVVLNAAAFAAHPEQGALTGRDLDRRLAQPWYTPGDLILAEAPKLKGGTSSAAGYVWVKIEDPVSGTGEIYAIGVHPDAQGSGLGTVLLDAGLRHLVERGARAAVLYVEGDNLPALRLYRRFGFEVSRTDALYAWSLNERDR